MRTNWTILLFAIAILIAFVFIAYCLVYFMGIKVLWFILFVRDRLMKIYKAFVVGV